MAIHFDDMADVKPRTDVDDNGNPINTCSPSDDKKQALAVGGARFDQGKTRVDLIPADVLLALGEIYRMGAEKYDATNWRKGMKWTKVYGPLCRHLYKAWIGREERDPESGQLHIMHALWNCVALAFYMSHPEYKRFDDRMDSQNFVDMPEADRQRLYVEPKK